MQKIISLIIGFSICSVALAQNPSEIWVYTIDSNRIVRGYLQELRDSSIVVKNKFSEEIEHVEVKNIKKIKLKKRANDRKKDQSEVIGAGIGVFAGIVAGATGSYVIPGSQCIACTGASADVSVTFPMLFGGLLGAIVGHVSGLFGRRLIIKGNHTKYLQKLRKLEKYLP